MIDKLLTAVPGADPAERARSLLAGRRVTRGTLAVSLLWLVLGLVVFGNKWGQFTPDIKPEIYLSPGRAAGDLMSSWFEDQQLGLPNFNVGLAPVAAFVALLHGLGLEAWVTLRVLRFLLLVIAACGATSLSRHLSGANGSLPSRVVAGVLFVVNPYLVVAGDTLAITLPLAFLPWQILFLLRSLERGGWRWPAAFALTFVPMSGMNAGVVPLLQLLYVPAVLWYVATRGTAIRSLAPTLARCALLAVILSLYWVVPSVAARGVGYNVVNNSETYRGISGPSSFSEVLRGLGLWVMYGRDRNGPWQPGFTPYLTNPLVIVTSFGLPVLFAASCLLVRGAVRRLAVLMVLLSAVVMVGLHPPADPAPVGVAMRAVFDHVPGAAAFRTTNKAGAVLVLGMALIVSVAAATLIRRLSGRRIALCAAALAVLVVGGAWPAFSGGLYSDRLSIPGYWRQAAAAVDAGSNQERVWLIPGEVSSHYRWSRPRVDDIDKSLLSRPSLVHYTIPNATPQSANLMSAVDTLLQEGALPPGALSAAARYMGVSDVLVRNDLVWEETAGARPSVVQGQVTSDTGLIPAGLFGDLETGPSTALSHEESRLPAVQHYRVADSRTMVRIEPVRGSVLVDGDGWSLAPMVAAGLLDRQPMFRYLGDTDPGQLAQALRAGTRLVITDTNRRRNVLTDRLTNSLGPLLTPAQHLTGSRTLFDDSAQTVLRVDGGRVSATAIGSVFGTLAYAAPENAFDGDERTAWLFGDFNNATGQTVRLRMPVPQAVAAVRLVARPVGPVSIARVGIQVGTLRRTVNVPPSGVVDVSIPTTAASSVTVSVLRTRGSGTNLVGINEVEIPGARTIRVARMPDRLTKLSQQLDPASVDRLTRTPIDVVFSRVRGTQAPGDDEEMGLNRDFTVPQTRLARLYGLVRPDEAAADDTIDRLLGTTGNVTATSSSRLFGSPAVRASFAVDGNAFTSWSPGGNVIGEALMLRGAPRRIDHVDVTQPEGAPGSALISRASLYLDGQLVAETALRPGTTRIPVTSQTARELRLVITGREGTGFVNVSELGFGDARIHSRPSAALRACVPVAELDGRPLMMRPVQPLTGMGATLFTGCGPRVVLQQGEHRLRALHDWMPDELVLRDSIGELVPAGQPVVAAARPKRISATHWQVSATLPSGPHLVVLGQNYDRRWKATIDGRSLGKPIVADGYSAAWTADSAGRHTIDIRFTAQRRATFALGVSALGLVLCLGLVAWRRSPSSAAQESRCRPRPRQRWDALPAALRWGLGVFAAWLIGGTPIALAAGAVAAWHALRPPTPRRLIRLSVVALALCPVAFMIGNIDRWAQISPDLVLWNESPHWIAATALLLLVVGIVRDDARSDARGPDHSGEGAG